LVMKKPSGKKLVEAASLFSVLTGQSDKLFGFYIKQFKEEIAGKTFSKELCEPTEVFFAKYGRLRVAFSARDAIYFMLCILLHKSADSVSWKIKLGVKEALLDICDDAYKQKAKKLFACYDKRGEELTPFKLTLGENTNMLCAVRVSEEYYVPLEDSYSALSGVSRKSPPPNGRMHLFGFNQEKTYAIKWCLIILKPSIPTSE